MRDTPPGDVQRWLRVRNETSEEIPPFAAMRMTGLTTTSTGTVINVAKPNTDSATAMILFNGPVAIPANKDGIGTRTFPLTAAYDTADGTPAAGDKWGPAASSWKLKNASDQKGYMFIGAGEDGFGPVVEAGGLYTLDCDTLTITGPT